MTGPGRSDDLCRRSGYAERSPAHDDMKLRAVPRARRRVLAEGVGLARPGFPPARASHEAQTADTVIVME